MKSLVRYRAFETFFIVVFTFTIAYISLRAWKIQFSIDEAASFFMYIQNGSFLPPHAVVDANNHILNSLLGYIAYTLAGSHPFILRIPNLLGFILFAFFTYRLTGLLHHRFPKYFLVILMMGTHFLLEFFAYCRGYGLSMAFLSGALYFLGRTSQKANLSSVLLSMTFTISGILANLNLVFTGLGITGILIVLILTQHLPKSPAKALGLTLAAAIPGLPAFGFFILESQWLKNASAFYYGAGTGFFPVTVRSLAAMISGDHQALFAIYALMLLIFFLGLAAMVYLKFPGKAKADPIPAVLFLLLVTNWTGALAINTFEGIHFQEDRAAMHYLPLFYLFLSFAIDRLSMQRPAWQMAILFPLIAVPFYSLTKLSLHESVYGKRQQVPEQFYSYIDQKRQPGNYPPVISAIQLQRQPWAFINYRNGGRQNLLYVHGHPWPYAGFIISSTGLADEMKGYYKIALQDAGTGSVLFERDTPVVYHEFKDTVSNFAFDAATEYSLLLESGVERLKGRQVVANVLLSLDSPVKPLEAVIVAEVFGEERNTLIYESIDLYFLKNEWTAAGEPCRQVMVIGQIPENAHSMLIYFWNKKLAECRVMGYEISILALE